MKIGIYSDLHLDFDEFGRRWDFEPQPGVFYINAGDTATAAMLRNWHLERHRDHAFHVLGNHDYWLQDQENDFPLDASPWTKTAEVGGLRVAGATLWTDLSSPLDYVLWKHNLVASRYIRPRVTEEMMREWHETQREFLLRSEADIVVSHHAPSYRSVSPRYVGNPLNPSFVSELAEDILGLPNPPRLWVHGHVHQRHDYMIGKTRVVAWPRGYPGEENYAGYEPLIVDV